MHILQINHRLILNTGLALHFVFRSRAFVRISEKISYIPLVTELEKNICKPIKINYWYKNRKEEYYDEDFSTKIVYPPCTLGVLGVLFFNECNDPS